MSARAALALDEDMPPLVDALQRLGARVATPRWDDGELDWSQFDVALLRSTWDYVERLPDFLAWTRHCANQTRLLNPAEVVAWNVDKRYLAHLHAAGVAVVPTQFIEPGSDAAAGLDAFLDDDGAGALSAGVECAFEQFVVKPSVGAGSRDAARYRRADRSRALAHLKRLVEAERRSAMLQPYLAAVDTEGETALIFLGGAPSHAIRKGPLLRLDEGLVEGLFAPEEIRARAPSEAERRLGAAAYAAIPFEPPLYARIDMIRDTQGAPVVLELELTEPSLFFAHAPGSAEQLARAVLARCGNK